MWSIVKLLRYFHSLFLLTSWKPGVRFTAVHLRQNSLLSFSLTEDIFLLLLKYIYVMYLFPERGGGREEGREEERERNINVWLPLTHSQLGTWPTTQACALTGNRTGYPFIRRLALNPLSYAIFLLLLERGERREKNINWILNLGMGPDWESNPQLFGLQANSLTNYTSQGQILTFHCKYLICT